VEEALIEEQEKILQAIKAKRWGQVEENWLNISEHPQPLSFHQPIIEKLIYRSSPDRFVSLYETYLDNILDKGHGKEALELIRFMLEMNPDQQWLRTRLITALKTAYRDKVGDNLDRFVEKIGLEDQSVPMKRGIAAFENLVSASVGQVFHHASWGLGVVKEMELDEGKVVIDFQKRPNREMTLEGVQNLGAGVNPCQLPGVLPCSRDYTLGGLRRSLVRNLAAIL